MLKYNKKNANPLDFNTYLRVTATHVHGDRAKSGIELKNFVTW